MTQPAAGVTQLCELDGDGLASSGARGGTASVGASGLNINAGANTNTGSSENPAVRVNAERHHPWYYHGC